MLEHSDDLTAEWGGMTELKPRFGISKSTGYRLAARKLIEVRKVGARTIVNFASVRRLIAQQPAPNLKQDDRSVRLGRRHKEAEDAATAIASP
jgi:hypothetical protein